MQKKISYFILIMIPMLYFMLTCVMTSILYRKVFSIMLALACGLWVVVVKMTTREFRSDLLCNTTIFAVLQFVFIVIMSLAVQNAAYAQNINGYMKDLLILFFLWAVYLSLRRMSDDKIKWLVRIYLVAIFVCTCFTLYVAIIGPKDVIRDTASGDFFDAPVPYGGFDFIYSLDIVYACLAYYLSINRDRLAFGTKLIMIAMLAVIFVTVALSNYTTALLLIVVSTIWACVVRVKHKALLFVALVGGFFVCAEGIAAAIKALPLSELTTSRLADVVLSMTGHAVEDTHLTGEGQRFDRILWSLRIILEHPIIGGYLGNTKLPFGDHTEWIEQFARYGLLYILLHMGFWVGAGKRILRQCERDDTRSTLKIGYWVLLLVGFLNPIALVTTPAPLFLLCPFLDKVFPVKSVSVEN